VNYAQVVRSAALTLFRRKAIIPLEQAQRLDFPVLPGLSPKASAAKEMKISMDTNHYPYTQKYGGPAVHAEPDWNILLLQ